MTLVNDFPAQPAMVRELRACAYAGPVEVLPGVTEKRLTSDASADPAPIRPRQVAALEHAETIGGLLWLAALVIAFIGVDGLVIYVIALMATGGALMFGARRMKRALGVEASQPEPPEPESSEAMVHSQQPKGRLRTALAVFIEQLEKAWPW